MSLAPSCLADREKRQELKKVRHFAGKGSRSKDATLGSGLGVIQVHFPLGEGSSRSNKLIRRLLIEWLKILFLRELHLCVSSVSDC